MTSSGVFSGFLRSAWSLKEKKKMHNALRSGTLRLYIKHAVLSSDNVWNIKLYNRDNI